MPKLTIDGKEIEVAAGTNLIEAARQARDRGAPLLLSPRRLPSPASAGCAWWTSRRRRGRRSPATRWRPRAWWCTRRPRGCRRRGASMHGVPSDQPSAGLSGVRPGGRVLPADLLHEARPLRPAHGRTRRSTSPRRCRSGPTSCWTRSAASSARAACASATRSPAPASSASSTAATTRRSASSRARLSRTTTPATWSTSARWARSPTATSASRCACGTLDTAKSVCTGCARGCNIEVHVNRRRPHHAEGRRVARLKPRFNADVNKWWICDEGRYGFGWVDAPAAADPAAAPARTTARTRGVGGARRCGRYAARRDRRPRVAPDVQRGPVGAEAARSSSAGSARWRSRCRRRVPGRRRRLPAPRRQESQHARRRADRPRRRRGGLLSRPRGPVGSAPVDLRPRPAGLGVAGRRRARGARRGVETVVFAGTNANATSAAAHWVLPTAAWVERDGTFTNFEGRVQRFRAGRRAARAGARRRGSCSATSWPRSAAAGAARGPSTGSASSPAPSRPSPA